MAWPGTLSPEEQVKVQVFVDQLVRPAQLRFVQGLNICRGIQLAWTAEQQALFTKLSANDAIPNLSGLAGASTLIKSQVAGVLTDFSAFLTTYDTDAQRAKYLAVIGAVNMVRES